jgi:hypothetical protein
MTHNLMDLLSSLDNLQDDLIIFDAGFEKLLNVNLNDIDSKDINDIIFLLSLYQKKVKKHLNKTLKLSHNIIHKSP